MKKPIELLKLNLQHFNDGGEEFGAYDPSTVNDGIEGLEDSSQAQAQAPEGQAPEGEGQALENPDQQAQAQQQISEYLDFGGRKVPANEDLQGLHKDWQEQQRYIQQLNEQANHYKQMVEFMQQQGGQQAPQGQQAQQAQQQGFDPDEFMEKFYENPVESLQNLINQSIDQSVKPIIDPIREEREWNSKVQQMNMRHEDFGNFTPRIQQILNENPQLAEDPNGLEFAYWRAKGEMASNIPSPDQLLQDPQFQQKIMQNENIRNQMINGYVSGKQQQRQNAAPVMGAQQGGFTPAMGENSPKSIREASRMYMKSLGIRN